jgi:hypothetical protein
MSPRRTPLTAPEASNSAPAAAKPVKMSTPAASALAPSQGTSCEIETMKLPWLRCCGGVGSR